MVKILGIVAHWDEGHEISCLMEESLEYCLAAAVEHAERESDPILETEVKHIYKPEDLPSLAGYILSAKVIILIAHSGSLGVWSGTGMILNTMNGDEMLALRKKWAGLIVYGNTPRGLMVDEGYRTFLAGCNLAGMSLLPGALAYASSPQAAELTRLGNDAAEMIASQAEWEGRTTRSEAA